MSTTRNYPLNIFDDQLLDPIHIGMILDKSTFSYEVMRQIPDDNRHVIGREYNGYIDTQLPRNTAKMNAALNTIMNELTKLIPLSKRADVTFSLIDHTNPHKSLIDHEWKNVTSAQAKNHLLELKPAILDATKQSWLEKICLRF
jgi:hypothetical protein